MLILPLVLSLIVLAELIRIPHIELFLQYEGNLNFKYNHQRGYTTIHYTVVTEYFDIQIFSTSFRLSNMILQRFTVRIPSWK